MNTENKNEHYDDFDLEYGTMLDMAYAKYVKINRDATITREDFEDFVVNGHS